jgi:NAD(P)-dependent dehydrogenase (short-subunit alcohol dehydrogenase family)
MVFLSGRWPRRFIAELGAERKHAMAERTAMVTGAGSGVGRAVAQRLLVEGYTVFGSAIDRDEAEELTRTLPGDFVPVLVDVRNEDSVKGAADEVRAHLNGRPLRALLNIAGVVTNGPLLDLSARTFQDLLAVNVVGMHSMTRAFVPMLREHEQPRIINMSSASGQRTVPFTGAYSASKFAVEALSSAMRMELAPFGIVVVVIAPGLMRTPMAARIREGLAKPPSLAVYREPLRRFLDMTEQALANGVPVPRVVDAIVASIEEREPPLRKALHQGSRRSALMQRVLPVRRREARIRRSLGLDARPG